MTRTIERRMRLPVALLLFAGYIAGAGLGLPVGLTLRDVAPIWWIIVSVFLYYVGHGRLVDVLRDMDSGLGERTTRADQWFDLIIKWGSNAAGVAFLALLSLGIAKLAADWGVNVYLSAGIGIFCFLGLLGFVLSEHGRGADDP
jgi:hypothetical protein